MSQAGRAVARPLVHRVERRHVPSHEELQGRLPVAEDVVRRPESRHQIFLLERAFLRRKHDGVGQVQIGSHLLLRKVITEVLEPQAALQRQAPARPAVLGVQRIHELMLFLGRIGVAEHRDRAGRAVGEDVAALLVVVEVDRVHRDVLVKAKADLRRVRAGDVRRRSLPDVRVALVTRPVLGAVVDVRDRAGRFLYGNHRRVVGIFLLAAPPEVRTELHVGFEQQAAVHR